MEPIYKGKVREIYDISDQHLIIVTTDRISAFDHILPADVKDKGIVLNQLSNFWFARTRNVVSNHIIDDRVENMPSFFQKEFFRNRTVLVEKLDMFPFEFVVRGYLFGSMWDIYENSGDFCGIVLPEHYRLAEKLEQPVITPAIKRDTGHDEYVSVKEVESRLGTKMTEQIIEICFELYRVCSEYAFSRGLVIADAKFEFGKNKQGKLVLADELFTPDSSRYWDADKYRVGVAPDSFDKQFLRDWLRDHKRDGKIPFDRVPEDILAQMGERYKECLRRLIK
ncbi:MAG: phosphoribosylaminoimidazolesuccinocarboxamide synthase [Roseburia sp.]|nr:phosphoribosylaminoimidazolesuccinocarboxamide synthase [Roseburia sp.]